MTSNISDAQLSRLNELVAGHCGLHFPPERWSDLERGLRAAAEQCGHGEAEPYLSRMLSSEPTQNQMEILVNHLTIGETYFFREKRALEILEGSIVPEILRPRGRAGKPLRIWSAGCSTGEEPYSVAIALSKSALGLKDGNIEILATDVNTRSLRKASEGIYTDWSFRGTPPWVRRTHFKAIEDGRWAIAAAIKKMVSFAPVNLMDDADPMLPIGRNGLDVIFCRNVLMYFTPEGMRKVIRQFHRSLAADGWLIVSATETSHELFPDFAAVSFGDFTLYRKSAKQLRVIPVLPVLDEHKLCVQQPTRAAEATVPPEAFFRDDKAGIHHPDARPVSAEPVNKYSVNEDPVNEDPPAVCYAHARRLYDQGLYAEADQMTAALLLQNASDAPSLFLRARIYANQGRLAEALVCCDQAVAADKMAAPVHYLRATILQEQSSLPEAILALKRAVYAEPEFVLGHFALGNLALKQGRLQESEKHFENVLLLLARYQPEDIVPESEGLSVGRLRDMLARPSTLGVVTHTNWERMRTQQQAGKFELSRR